MRRPHILTNFNKKIRSSDRRPTPPRRDVPPPTRNSDVLLPPTARPSARSAIRSCYPRLPTAFFERRRAPAGLPTIGSTLAAPTAGESLAPPLPTFDGPPRGIMLRITEELVALLHVVAHRPGGALQRRCPPDADLAPPRRAQRRLLPAAPLCVFMEVSSDRARAPVRPVFAIVLCRLHRSGRLI